MSVIFSSLPIIALAGPISSVTIAPTIVTPMILFVALSLTALIWPTVSSWATLRPLALKNELPTETSRPWFLQVSSVLPTDAISGNV